VGLGGLGLRLHFGGEVGLFLLDKVWDVQSDIESNVVEVTLKNIRKKLKESNSEIEILSKRNIGYWIEN
jgi:DNA-binding response OmpR family regulator